MLGIQKIGPNNISSHFVSLLRPALANTDKKHVHASFFSKKSLICIWFKFPSKISRPFWMFANIIWSNHGYLACCYRRPFIKLRVHAADWLRPNNAFTTFVMFTNLAASTDESTCNCPLLPANGAINCHIRWASDISLLSNQFSGWCMACCPLANR